MDIVNSNRSYSGLVEKYIGTAYDHIKRVSDNLDELLKLADIDNIEDIVESINNAEAYALAAKQSAIEAAASAAEADATVQAFNDFYLGPYSVPPTVNNDGDPLFIGALYLDTAVTPQLMMFWEGTSWLPSFSSVTGVSHAGLIDLDADDHTQYLTEDRHLALDPTNHPFLPLTGGVLSGMVEVEHEVKIVSDGVNHFTGFSVYSDVGDFKGGFDWNPAASDSMQLWQQGAGGTDQPDTLLQLANGKAALGTWDNAYVPPTLGLDLTPKQYVDDEILLAPFLSKSSGGDAKGVISGEEEVKVYEGTGVSLIGFTVYSNDAETTPAFKGGVIWGNTVDNPIDIWQQGTGNTLQPDTKLVLVGGKAKLNSFLPGNPTLAVDPDDLTTKAFTDANYINATSNAIITGKLKVTGEVDTGWRSSTHGDGLKSYVGFSVYDIDNPATETIRAAFDWERVTDTLTIHQTGAGAEGFPDTVLSLKDGRANLSSTNGLNTTPVNPLDLVNKNYVDTKFTGATGSFTSSEGKLIQVVNGIITTIN